MTTHYLCIPLSKSPSRLTVETLNITQSRLFSDLGRKFSAPTLLPVVPAEKLAALVRESEADCTGLVFDPRGFLTLANEQEPAP